MNTKNTEIAALPWVMDDGCVDMASQADQLLAKDGTDGGWRALGMLDEDGFAEVVALAHPVNAEYIVRAANAHHKLVEALEYIKGTLEHVEGCEDFDLRAHPRKDIYALIEMAEAALQLARNGGRE